MRKKMFVAMIASVMTIGAVAAQTGKEAEGEKNENLTAEQMAKIQTERMTKVFALNEQQQKRLYDYDIKRFAKLKKKAETERHEQELARKNHDEQMQKILTPEQYRKWSRMQK